MSKFVVVVVPDEKKAYEALHAIRDLHDDGSLTLYAASVVERRRDGTIDVKQAADQGPVGFAVGSLVGVLGGVVGGPAGAAVGMATGGLLGGWGDYMRVGVSEDFVKLITREVAPGNFAVFAEVSEDWVAPLDTKIEALGARVFREYRDEFVDDMIEKRADSVRNDLDQRKVERAGAKAEKMEAKLAKRIDEAREEMQKTASKARERLEQKKDEMNAKIGALQEQAGKASPEVKSRIEQRIAEIRAELQTREQKLNHAYEMAQQALSP